MTTDLLELETRRRLYDHVTRHPGQYLREIQRALGLPMGMLEFHLGRLERAGLIVCENAENKRFFPAPMLPEERRSLAFLRQSQTRRILLALLHKSPRTFTELSTELELVASTLRYQLGKLVAVGLLGRRRAGRNIEYWIVEPEPIVKLLIAHRSSLFDRLVDAFLEGVDSFRL